MEITNVGTVAVQQRSLKADHLQDGHVVGDDVKVARQHQGRCWAASPPPLVDLDEDADVEREEGEAEDEVGDEEVDTGCGEAQTQVWGKALARVLQHGWERGPTRTTADCIRQWHLFDDITPRF